MKFKHAIRHVNDFPLLYIIYTYVYIMLIDMYTKKISLVNTTPRNVM